MSSDLDNVLQNLEQQVKDFSMDIGDTNQEDSINKDTVKHQQSTRQVNTHHSRSGQRYKAQQQDSDDDGDNDIIGHLLQSPTFPSTPSSTTKATTLDQQASNAALKKLGLARSLSSSTRKFPKKLLPDEPVPCIPLPSSTSPPSNCATNTSGGAVPVADTQNDADDLQQAMQLAWAVLDAEPSSDAQTKESSPLPQQDETKVDTARLQTTSNQQHHGGATTGSSSSSSAGMTAVAPTQTMTTRIFIEDAKNHKTVQLTNVLTTAMVIQYLKRKDLLDNSGDWTLFEIANSHGVERPLRLWEIVMDITGCWEQNTNNALLVKKYGFYETLTMDAIRDRPSPVHGWLYIEYKKGKWQKRYCFIKDHAIHHAKDSKCANSAILCHLAAFDVYTLLQPSSTCPTPFVFALRAQDRAAIFEKEQDYMRLLTAENQSSLETWVLGIRQAKSIIQYQQHPKRVQNPLAALTTATTTSSSGGGDAGLRRYKSTKREPTAPPPSEDTNNTTNASEGRPRGMSRSESSTRRITDETIKRKASIRGLSRNGTTRNRDHHHQHDTKDANGMPATTTATTATTVSDEGNNGSSTLIQIEDKWQFSKGSLLDKGNTAPHMTPVPSTPTAAITPTSSAPPSSTSNTNHHHHHHHHHHHQPTQNGSSSTNGSSNSSSNRTMMSRSKSTRETSSHSQHRSRANDGGGVLSHQTSIRRKDRGGLQQQQQQQHDVPLPNTHAIMTSSSGTPLSTTSSLRNNNTDNTLLKLNNTPERCHTQTLLQRQMKPLLNFDQDLSSDHRRG